MSYNNSSSSYNYGGGSGGWDNNANEVSYGDSYAAFDNDDGNDPYNFKIKDPKKEKRKKEKKERRRKAKERSTTARLSIEERTAKRLAELRSKRESKIAEIGPPPEDTKSKKDEEEQQRPEDDDDDDSKGPEQDGDDDYDDDDGIDAKAKKKKTKTIKPYKTKKQKRREKEDRLSTSFDSDLSESDFISGGYTKKRMEEYAAEREAVKTSQQDMAKKKRQKEEEEAAAAQQAEKKPSFDTLNDSLATDDMDLGGTGNVRIGSVDSPMLKKYKERNNKPSTQGSSFADMAKNFSQPVNVSPLPSPNKYITSSGKPKASFNFNNNNNEEQEEVQNNIYNDSNGPEMDEREEELSSSISKACVVDGCDAPEYMIQRNGRCQQHNNRVSPSRQQQLQQDNVLNIPSNNMNNNNKNTVIDEQLMEDKVKQYANEIVEEARRKIDEAEKRALQASTDATNALELAKQVQARADAMESTQRASVDYENNLKSELEAKYKAEMEQKYRIEMEAKYKIETEARQKAEADAFEKLQAEAKAAAELERQNQSFNTRLNNVTTKARETVAEQVATVESNLRDSHDGPPPPPPPAGTSKTKTMQSANVEDDDAVVGILGRIPKRSSNNNSKKKRSTSPGPPPPPTASNTKVENDSNNIAPSPNRFGFVGGVEQRSSDRNRNNNNNNTNYEARKMAWELREARLEEELDEVQLQNNELRGQLGRLEKELIKSRESVAHHRQKAVEARLELQEMKGASSLRASRLRRSAKLEEAKKIEDRSFTMPAAKKEEEEEKKKKMSAYDGPSEEELRKLEKDLESQEMLLQGLNKENQKMADEARQTKLVNEETQRRMFEEHERLNKVVNNLTQQLQLGDTATSVHQRAMDLEKQLNKDSEIAKLKEDIEENSHRWKNKEEELKLQIEILKKEKKDLVVEMKTREETVDRSDTAAMQQLQRTMNTEKRRYEESLSVLKKRLAWYAENQDMIDKNDELVKNQQNQITTLKKRLVQLEEVARVVARRGMPGTPKVKKGSDDLNNSFMDDDDSNISGARHLTGKVSMIPSQRHPDDIKTIKQLKDKLVELSDALKKRNPNSVAALIQASGPPEELINERDTLKKTVIVLKESLEKQKDEYEKRLRRFRQDHEKIRTAMERQIDSNTGNGSSNNNSFTMGGDDDDNSEITTPRKKNTKKDDSTFRWYQKKILEMEKKCEAKVRAAKRGNIDSSSSSSHSNDSKKKIDSLNSEIKKLTRNLTTFKKRTEKAENEVTTLKTTISSNNNNNKYNNNTTAEVDDALIEKLRRRSKKAEEKLNMLEDEHQDEIDDLNADIKKLKNDLRNARKKAADSSSNNALSPSRIPKSSPSTGNKELERRLDVAKGRIAVLEQENKRLSKNKSALGESVNTGNGNNVEQLMERAETAERMVQYLEKEKEEMAQNAKLEIESLNGALQRQAAGVPIALTTLERKLSAIEQRRREREMELQRVVNDITQRHHSEKMALQRKMDIALQEKDIQIQRFRMELDTLLRAAREVKLRSSMNRPKNNNATDPGGMEDEDENLDQIIRPEMSM